MIPRICIVVLCTSLLHGSTCDGLRKLKLSNATITAAEEVAGGALQSPSADLQQFSKTCRRSAELARILTPTPDSDVRIEVWMPLKAWNSRFISNGNGGFAGSIVRTALARAVAQGFAAASADTGHQSTDPSDARWALGHPEKLVDFGWRAIHEMTVTAKVIVQVFYGAAAEYSYFSGCSNGGRQAHGSSAGRSKLRYRLEECQVTRFEGAGWSRVFRVAHGLDGLTDGPNTFLKRDSFV